MDIALTTVTSGDRVRNSRLDHLVGNLTPYIRTTPEEGGHVGQVVFDGEVIYRTAAVHSPPEEAERAASLRAARGLKEMLREALRD